MFGSEATERTESIDARNVPMNALDLINEQWRSASIAACDHAARRLYVSFGPFQTNGASDRKAGATKITLQVFAGDNVVYITAHDNHGRIRPDVLQRIFEPFKTTT
jgi:signal transduction histidine kinase